MEIIDLGTPLKETVDGLRNYIDQLVGYNKLIFAKKIGELSSYLTLLIALSFLSTLALIFLSFSFVWWFSALNPDKMYFGYLIVAGFYTLVAILIYLFRERLIFKPIRKALGNVIFSDADTNQKNEVFDSSEMLDAKIKNAKESLSSQEKELNVLVDKLGEQYSFKNIAIQMFQNAYNSMITTANIGKLAFNMVKTLQKRRTNRQSKTETPKLRDKKKK